MTQWQSFSLLAHHAFCCESIVNGYDSRNGAIFVLVSFFFFIVAYICLLLSKKTLFLLAFLYHHHLFPLIILNHCLRMNFSCFFWHVFLLLFKPFCCCFLQPAVSARRTVIASKSSMLWQWRVKVIVMPSRQAKQSSENGSRVAERRANREKKLKCLNRESE